MDLKADETELVGKWEWKNNRMAGDATEKRIQWLVTNVLKQKAYTAGGYEILYQDPRDGRYWERTFPEPQGHGAGPQKLSPIEARNAIAKYKI